ncbi:MAG TPA: ImmA/IrrE family metallo-endopeptidase [Candidatus Angelobacter sp.]
MDEYRSRAGHTGKLYVHDSQVTIRVPEEIAFETARISVAHEIGHVLIHRRGNDFDHATIRLPSSPEEEALAEYAARLLLLPVGVFQPPLGVNLAQYAVEQAGTAKVTVHSAVSRLGDPDIFVPGIIGAILWRINPNIPESHPVSSRLTPQWHLCPGHFVPVKRCKARAGSLIARVADSPSAVSLSAIETVSIGTFVGTFRVDAFGWGSIPQGTRLALAIFRNLSES